MEADTMTAIPNVTAYEVAHLTSEHVADLSSAAIGDDAFQGVRARTAALMEQVLEQIQQTKFVNQGLKIDWQDDTSAQSVTALSDKSRYASHQKRLINAIDKMLAVSPDWSGEEITISREAADAGKRFIAALRPEHELPKLAASDDGDLLLVWENATGRLLATVEGERIHAVRVPRNGDVEAVPDQHFFSYLPVRILAMIPRR